MQDHRGFQIFGFYPSLMKAMQSSEILDLSLSPYTLLTSMAKVPLLIHFVAVSRIFFPHIKCLYKLRWWIHFTRLSSWN
ncbi:hypothetical protein EUGRSUZ_D02657 [Eucalyptus grandis]|uniref:Uncharacterized protein n=2 Tax=Eucalyptus grandis TaxID=71139 RepID=A0ACC3LRU0_EUCGR|nr:hypothetical protein EUGRSUZ_D02657 [Eucalyptus grandis]